MATTVFMGRPYQRGGIGGVFGTVMRGLIPALTNVGKEAASQAIKHGPGIAKNLAKEAGKEALAAGIDALGDVAAGKSVKSAAKRASKKASKSVKRLSSDQKKALAAYLKQKLARAQKGSGSKKKQSTTKKSSNHGENSSEGIESILKRFNVN